MGCSHVEDSTTEIDAPIGMRGELAAPSFVFASGVEVNEGLVKADTTLEVAFVTEVAGDGVGFARSAFEDEVESAILGVPRAGSASAGSVVGGVTVGGSDELQWLTEAFTNFVGDEQGGGHGRPELDGRKGVRNSARGLAVGIDDFLRLDVAQVESGEEFLVGERLGGGWIW